MQGIALSSTLTDNLPVVDADQGIIQRVLQNLLSNAVKFTPPNGHVEISTFTRDQFMHVCIDDTGPGIPPDQREQIFEKFGQVSRGDQKQGHGLGLTFCKLAVEQHGGHIHVEDAPTGGSRFVFALPLSQNITSPAPS
jgi:signal transduction histidine kinase